MKITDKQMEILEQYFGVDKTEYANGNFLTLEQWTDGGVDMIIEIEMAEEKDLITELEKYIDNFNIDEEIELYRESKDYRENFTIRESVKDFENWETYVRNCIKDLKEISK